MTDLELDPTLLETLRTLSLHDVEFVLAGPIAEAIYNHGGFVPGLTIVPAGYGRNVERLGGALHALDAQLGSGPAAAPLDPRLDVRDLAPCSFTTRLVDVEVDFAPPGTKGYRDLFDDAAHIELAAGIRPLVAALDDLERIARGGATSEPYAEPPAALPPEPDADPASWHEQIRAGRPSRI